MKLGLAFMDRTKDFGLLTLRLGIGVMFCIHGWGKITGGPEAWERLGSAMSNLGVTFAPTFWGFMAAFAEFGGGLLLALGLATRLTCLFLLLPTMIVATTMHVMKGDDFNKYSHALEAGILFLSLFFIGPGRYSMDARCCGANKKGEARGS